MERAGIEKLIKEKWKNEYLSEITEKEREKLYQVMFLISPAILKFIRKKNQFYWNAYITNLY